MTSPAIATDSADETTVAPLRARSTRHARRLPQMLSTSPQFWMRPQAGGDLRLAVQRPAS